MTVREIWLTTTCDLYIRGHRSDAPPRQLPSGGMLQAADARMLVIGIEPKKNASESTPHLILSVAAPEEVRT